ncbi:hypothetical protein M9458_035038, partial [Cirrhinus mrigala]
LLLRAKPSRLLSPAQRQPHQETLPLYSPALQLKTDKAPKEQVDAAIKQLLALKSEFKQLTGQEYKPGMAPLTSAPTPAAGSPSPASSGCPYTRVTEQGEVVRKLKAEKAPK